MLHAKAMKFDDDLAIIGSANLDIRSLLLNFEISCFISSAEDVKNLETWMMSIQQRCSLDFKKPTFFKMLLEDAAQLIKPLL
jgi:cardiolipin synthase